MSRRPAFLVPLLLLAACQQKTAPAVGLEQAPGKAVTVQASGLDSATLDALKRLPDGADGWAAVLKLSVGPGLPPVIGRYAVEGRALRFTPSFPLEPGRAYVARLDPGGGRPPLTVSLTPAADAAAAARVSAVYPSGPVQPQNLLRLYVQFSAPMSVGQPGALQLLDGQGKAVDEPFLPLGYEFWSPDRTRLTVLVDPGRVKRGILPGPVLKEGERYTMVVGPGWRDARGTPIAGVYRQDFRAGPPERRALDARAWRVTAPKAGSRAPLAVDFGRSLDRALLLSAMGVATADGDRLEGKVQIAPGEAGWSFTPDHPWTDKSYSLAFQPWLEDPAGNRPGRPFEQAAGTVQPTRQGVIALPFRPAP